MKNNYTYKFQEEYTVVPEDFHLGNTSVDKSFDDCSHTRIDLFMNNENLGYIIITKDIDKSPFVRFVWIYPDFRGFKHSKRLYVEANSYSENRYRSKLSSDQLSFVRRNAQNIWEDLVSEGVAMKENNRYIFV